MSIKSLIEELSSELDLLVETNQRHQNRIAAAKRCQRYTIHAEAYTTDNPTGKWMKSEDVLAALENV